MSRDTVAHRYIGDGVAYCHDNSCRFMARDHVTSFCGLTADDGVAVVQAHIAATDGGSFGLHQDLVGLRLRTFAIGNHDLLITGENYCTHFRASFYS
uniref:Uncharacterized protein n=1 Tax=Arthrobacter sp. AK-1 TaxID=415095 RepID=A6YFH9_9MICC|nr:unknown [Arthrobacter sp. AK-1]